MRNRSRWYSFAFTAVVLMTAAVAPAQGAPDPAAPPKTDEVKEVKEAKKAKKAPEAKAVDATAEKAKAEKAKPMDAPRYGRVVSKEVKVLCFASQRSPAYEDVLREGDVVMVGAESGEFVQVILPLGVVGYVHRDFTTTPEEGVVTTTRPRVSFRYRPKAGEAPTQLLTQGTPLRYLGTHEDWWKVRMVPEAAWVGIKDVQVFGEASPTLVKSYEALRKLHEEQCATAAAEYAKLEAEAKLKQAQAQKLEELGKQVQEASTLPDDKQLEKLTEVSNGLEDLKKEIAAKTPAKAKADLLTAEIKSLRLAAAARLLLKEQPKPATDVAPGPRLAGAAPFKRFAVTGWLRFDRYASGHLRCRLEKGKKAVAFITCSSGRYDLSVFDGVEVGVRGAQTSNVLATAPVVDAMRLEVLSVGPD